MCFHVGRGDVRVIKVQIDPLKVALYERNDSFDD